MEVFRTRQELLMWGTYSVSSSLKAVEPSRDGRILVCLAIDTKSGTQYGSFLPAF